MCVYIYIYIYIYTHIHTYQEGLLHEGALLLQLVVELGLPTLIVKLEILIIIITLIRNNTYYYYYYY